MRREGAKGITKLVSSTVSCAGTGTRSRVLAQKIVGERGTLARSRHLLMLPSPADRSHSRAPSGDEADDEQHQKDDEANLRDCGSNTSDGEEAQKSRNECDHKEKNSVIQHLTTSAVYRSTQQAKAEERLMPLQTHKIKHLSGRFTIVGEPKIARRAVQTAPRTARLRQVRMPPTPRSDIRRPERRLY
jgi:hypothetical protein